MNYSNLNINSNFPVTLTPIKFLPCLLVKPILASFGVSLPVSLAGNTPNSLFITLTLSPINSSIVPVLKLASSESSGKSGLPVLLFCLFVDNHKGLLGSL